MDAWTHAFSDSSVFDSDAPEAPEVAGAPEASGVSETPVIARVEDQAERLRRIRLLIDSGLYETPERIDATIDRLAMRLSHRPADG